MTSTIEYREEFFSEKSLEEKIKKEKENLTTLVETYSELQKHGAEYEFKAAPILAELHNLERSLQFLQGEEGQKIEREIRRQISLIHVEKEKYFSLKTELTNRRINLKNEWLNKHISLVEYKRQLDEIDDQLEKQHQVNLVDNLSDEEKEKIARKIHEEYEERINKLIDEIRPLKQENLNLRKSITNYHSYQTFITKVTNIGRDIEQQKKIILEYESMETYSEEEAVKYNCLGYHPDTSCKSDEVDYENLLIELYRTKYEEYNRKNNIFPFYSSIIRLIEEFYTEKKHPYPEVIAHLQHHQKGVLEEIIEQLYLMGMEVELYNEIIFLKKMNDTGTSPHKYLIKKCNEHHLKVIMATEKIKMKCPDHGNCFYQLGNMKCDSGFYTRIEMYPSMYYKIKNIISFNIECKLSDILSLLYVRTSSAK